MNWKQEALAVRHVRFNAFGDVWRLRGEREGGRKGAKERGKREGGGREVKKETRVLV